MRDTWEAFGAWEVDGFWYRRLTDAELECVPGTAEESPLDADDWERVAEDWIDGRVALLDWEYRIPADQGVGIGYRLPTECERREGMPDNAESWATDLGIAGAVDVDTYRIPLSRMWKRAEIQHTQITVGYVPALTRERIDQLRDEIQARRKAEPAIHLCTCGHHAIEPGADPYAAHREWMWSRLGSVEWQVNDGIAHVPGIGISRPTIEVGIAVMDWEADGI